MAPRWLLLSVILVAACSVENDESRVAQRHNDALQGRESPADESAVQSDLAREKRLAEQIVDAVFDGEPIMLDAEGHSFLGISMQSSTGDSKKAALILHGRGYHPDWEQVVRPLRVGLTQHGWNTLSIQMPVLGKEAKYYDYIPVFPESFPRIEAGIQYLRSQGNETIVLIAHSCGVHMAMQWVRERDATGIDGFIGIGMGATDYQQPMPEPFPLEKITVPVLDIYGAMDYPAVQNGAPGRLAAIHKAGNPHSQQIIMEEADHYMHDQDEVLVETVARWLDSVF